MNNPINPLEPMRAPELVIGLVSPLGSDLELIIEILESELNKVRYSSSVIKLSGIFRLIPEIENILKFDNEENRIRTHMDAGTKVREVFGRGDVLSLFSIGNIRQIRLEKGGDEKTSLNRHAFILRSIKHKDEVKALRNIYGKGFVLISVFSPRDKRLKRLARVMSDSNNETDGNKYRAEAEGLIARDEDEEGRSLGQGVTDAFPLADFFVTSDDRSAAIKSISRFIEILFGHPFHTPSSEEFGMFQARSAALQSSDLSRQVGACISFEHSELVAVGCNEVPKAFGGIYPDIESGNDKRDFQIGYDSNSKIKLAIINEVIERFKKAKWLSDEKNNSDTKELVRDLMEGKDKKILSGSQIMNLLEFGRVVHAEMNALMDAAKRGNRVKGAVLYCTTFPCHMCARHIIAAGISKVVYVEPYPKSLVNDLYQHEVSTEGDGNSLGRVEFKPFVGVAPRRFHEFFEMPIRKDRQGNALDWKAVDACPTFERYIGTYIQLELDVLNALPAMCEEAGIQLM